MDDLFEISDQILDGSINETPPMRFDFNLTELIEGVARVNAFSLSIVFKTGEGLVVFDTGLLPSGKPIVDSIRNWTKDPFRALIYTHGHADHVGGSRAFIDDAKAKGNPIPDVVGHENVLKRFDRYKFTDGYNRVINMRQTGLARNRSLWNFGERPFLDESVAVPNITYSDRFSYKAGDLTFELHHAKGETDDHTWAWVPEKKVICPGDLFIWLFPNAGNPQKVQRYPLEWAHALREMAGMGAEYFFPSHGFPIRGAERIRSACLEVAGVLEKLVMDTVEMMNHGAALNEIIHTVKVDRDKLAKGFLRPLYDDPEFVVHNVWRMYGGWYDGNPANLKPARDEALAAEISEIAGGAGVLAKRAEKIAEDGDLRLAGHLIEMAYMAAPEDVQVNGIRADIYRLRRKAETSLMAKAIYGQAETLSKEIAGKDEG